MQDTRDTLHAKEAKRAIAENKAKRHEHTKRNEEQILKPLHEAGASAARRSAFAAMQADELAASIRRKTEEEEAKKRKAEDITQSTQKSFSERLREMLSKKGKQQSEGSDARDPSGLLPNDYFAPIGGTRVNHNIGMEPVEALPSSSDFTAKELFEHLSESVDALDSDEFRIAVWKSILDIRGREDKEFVGLVEDAIEELIKKRAAEEYIAADPDADVTGVTLSRYGGAASIDVGVPGEDIESVANIYGSLEPSPAPTPKKKKRTPKKSKAKKGVRFTPSVPPSLTRDGPLVTVLGSVPLRPDTTASPPPPTRITLPVWISERLQRFRREDIPAGTKVEEPVHFYKPPEPDSFRKRGYSHINFHISPKDGVARPDTIPPKLKAFDNPMFDEHTRKRQRQMEDLMRRR
jgi:hypothetical protein